VEQTSHKPYLKNQKLFKLLSINYIAHTEILSTFHTRVKYIYVIQTNGDANAENPKTVPSPWGT